MSLKRSGHFPYRLILLCMVYLLASILMTQGQDASSSTKATVATPAYDVVSIKPDKGNGPYSGWWRGNDDGFSADVTVRNYIMSAYNLIMENQISGLPEWANSTQFEIQAKLDPDKLETYKKLSREDRGKQDSLMLQALLADRFQLKIRHELKQLPVYQLVVAKGGPRVKETPSTVEMGYSVGSGHLSGHGIEIQSLTVSLSNIAGRLIVNKTGLTGKYDIDLAWSRETGPESGDTAPSLFTALQEQLGLKLESTKAPVETIVIEHIEKPSEN
jgi:uncharacterized protein (TIGR03435 family)